MITPFDGFEINPIHEGDAWKICDFAIINTDRLKRYFPKTLEQNLNPTLSLIYVENQVKAFQNKELFVFTLKQLETQKIVGLIIIKEVDCLKCIIDGFLINSQCVKLVYYGCGIVFCSFFIAKYRNTL